MWRKVILSLFAVVVVTGTLVLWSGEEKVAPGQETGSIKYVVAEGRVAVKPDRRAVLSAEVAGRLERIFVDNLAPVEEGQLLAVQYNADLAEQIRQTEEMGRKAQASYSELINGSRREDIEEAGANLNRAEASMELAERNELRDRQLFEEGVIARSRYDVTAAELKQARADKAAAGERYAKISAGERHELILAARAEMMSQKYALESLKAAYEKTRIRSPLKGIVVMRYRNASEFADVGQPILEVADLSEMIVEGDVNEMDAGRVKSGRKAVITSDAFPGQPFAGEVYEVSQALKRRESDPEDPSVIVDQKVLPIKVRLVEPIPLKLGMKVDLKIEE